MGAISTPDVSKCTFRVLMPTNADGIAVGNNYKCEPAGDAWKVFIDKSTQQISVIQNGRLLYVWPVSTGQDRFSTPSGVYTPERLERVWFSRVYYNSPMPHAIFFPTTCKYPST